MKLFSLLSITSIFTISVISVAGDTSVLVTTPGPLPASWKESALSEHEPPYLWTLMVQSRDIPGLTTRMYQIAEENKGKWLTDDELDQYARPTQEATDVVMKYLYARGIKQDQIKSSRYGDRIFVNTTIGKTAEIFNAEFRDYKIGNDVVPRTMQYTIAAEISPHVKHVSPISDFPNYQPSNVATASGPVAASTKKRRATNDAIPAECDENDVTQKCLKKFYGTGSYTPKKTNNKAVDVALIGFTDDTFDQKELSAYLKEEGPPGSADYQVPFILKRNAVKAVGSEINVMIELETILSQIYPLTTSFINFGYGTRHEDGFDFAFYDFIESYTSETRPKVVFITWEGVENWLHKSQGENMCETVQKLVSLGVTLIAVAGNGGVSDGYMCPSERPLFPSACPYVLSAGSTKGFNPEGMAYKQVGDKKILYSGSASSNVFGIPDYQKAQVAAYHAAIGTERGHYNKSSRAYPDLVSYGDFNMRFAAEGKPWHFGGSTASASFIASVVALTNNKRELAGLGSVGFAHPALYENLLHDIIDGGSYYCGNTTFGFQALPGYDQSSGVGSAHFDLFTKAFGV